MHTIMCYKSVVGEKGTKNCRRGYVFGEKVFDPVITLLS